MELSFSHKQSLVALQTKHQSCTESLLRFAFFARLPDLQGGVYTHCKAMQHPKELRSACALRHHSCMPTALTLRKLHRQCFKQA